MQQVLVTGGTGTLGRLIVPRLRDAGRKVRVLSRRGREAGEGVEFVTGDLATGEGIDAAVEGAGIIVHCAGSSKGDEDKALNLIRAASRAGARHLVYISVVGADRIPVVSGVDRAMFGYFASKLDAERAVAGAGIPSPVSRSPITCSTPASPSRPCLLSTRTARPCVRSRATTRRPSVPVPPVTRIGPASCPCPLGLAALMAPPLSRGASVTPAASRRSSPMTAHERGM